MFFTEPGARWLITLKRTRILTFQTIIIEHWGLFSWSKSVKSAFKACRFPRELTRMALLWNRDSYHTYSHRMTPFFNSFWKSEPMGRSMMSWIHSLSSSSFWRSYFCAIWVGGEVKDHVSQGGGTQKSHAFILVKILDTRNRNLRVIYELHPGKLHKV